VPASALQWMLDCIGPVKPVTDALVIVARSARTYPG